jgi:hypothetical protein
MTGFYPFYGLIVFPGATFALEDNYEPVRSPTTWMLPRCEEAQANQAEEGTRRLTNTGILVNLLTGKKKIALVSSIC